MSKVWLVSDGVALVDGGGAFGLVPRPRWMKILPPDDQNRVPQMLWSVLIEADGQRILIDTGAGDKTLDKLATQYDLLRPHGSLPDALSRLGFSSGDINVVILTHLHGDHCGWSTVRAEDGRIVPTYPNARYYVQRAEYEDAIHPNERTRNTYFAENFIPLLEHGVLTLLDGPAQITPSISVMPTPGHTAGHQSVAIEGVAQVHYTPMDGTPVTLDPPPSSTLVMLGDLACYAVHFARLPWVTAYDVLPLITVDSKREMQRWVLDHQAMIVAAHDAHVPVGVLTPDARGFLTVQPAETR